MAGEALYYGTGRRKNAVARVRLVPGTGKVTINGRDALAYFGRQALVNYALTPFKVTDTTDHFDVIATLNGGGISGQAGALRHGISRALLAAGDYRGELLLVFENGKAARIPVSAYETKTNRRRLTGAYSDKSPLVAVLPLYAGSEVVLFASDGRALLFPPEAVPLKASRTTQGVAVMALKKKAVVTQAQFAPDTLIHNHARYRARSLPAAGALLREDDRGEEQMSLI